MIQNLGPSLGQAKRLVILLKEFLDFRFGLVGVCELGLMEMALRRRGPRHSIADESVQDLFQLPVLLGRMELHLQ